VPKKLFDFALQGSLRAANVVSEAALLQAAIAVSKEGCTIHP